ncbi:MAG: hypothetical protein PHR35_21050 [Kiritimatiellae bacterium]|nr:hypothetical protein [Kiritimatiellia bacterium]
MDGTRVVAVVEPHWTGHPETQLKLFTEALLQGAGTCVLVLCQHPEVIRKWVDSAMPEYADRCRTALFSYGFDRGAYPNARLANWARLGALLTDEERAWGRRVDVVTITWLDSFLCDEPVLASELMPRPWVGLYLFPTYLRPTGLRARLFPPRERERDRAFLKMPCCRGVAVLDEGVARGMGAVARGIPVVAMPDVPDCSLPSANPPLVERVLRQAAGRPIVALLGVLGRRKGVLCFLRAALAMQGTQCCFLLAGRLGEEERRTYRRAERELDALLQEAGHHEHILLHLEAIETEAAFNALMTACTVLYLAYEDHPHSSGLLGKAAQFGKLVVVGNYGCMRERVRRFRLGLTIRAGSTRQAVAAIAALCRPRARARRLRRARFAAYLAEHNKTRLREALVRLIWNRNA